MYKGYTFILKHYFLDERLFLEGVRPYQTIINEFSILYEIEHGIYSAERYIVFIFNLDS